MLGNYIMYINIDINECLNYNGACGQICTNTNGSYTCSCNSGFQIKNDGHNCTGIIIFNVYYVSIIIVLRY